MFGVRDFVERFHLFERNRFPFELKVLGLAFYVQMSSIRRTARALSEFRRVSKTAVWRWVVKLKACLSLSVDVKPRRFIAVDETCVKANGLEYYVFSALDVDRNEVVCMRVYPSRNMLAAESFFRRVL
ncbi:DDE-type integrase/transposase/recombinase, partial [Candidatus Bathyarchaeota archaeon]|nr:DDE-type integrase/transposase/recombinase [Candidatus Bathyarchaeota archaeon]